MGLTQLVVISRMRPRIRDDPMDMEKEAKVTRKLRSEAQKGGGHAKSLGSDYQIIQQGAQLAAAVYLYLGESERGRQPKRAAESSCK